ncbi:MAG: helix-turn-helix transcriptional regulator [Desulfobacteraceae bacterium]|nr:helix-turn-helix transcriptional regulator [Desulfobacteraceae bacterium]
MDKSEFASFRKKLKKTQTQMAQLLGISIKAIHSYEQGWRKIPPHIERQILFLLSNIRGSENSTKSCWIIKKCPKEKKTQCPAWEFQSGKLCWFISGTICSGTAHKTWQDKIKICRECEVLSSLLL